MAGLLQYFYEPHVRKLPNAATNLPMWCGPHRFAHPDDPHPNTMDFDSFFLKNRAAFMELHRLQDEIKSWCVAQTGSRYSFRKNSRWSNYGFHVFFRHERDAFAFRLRWC